MAYRDGHTVRELSSSFAGEGVYSNLGNYNSTGYDRYAKMAPVMKLRDPHYTTEMQPPHPPPSSPPGSFVSPQYGGLGYTKSYDALTGTSGGTHHTLASAYGYVSVPPQYTAQYSHYSSQSNNKC